jgi:hypothetical protein
LLQLMITAFWRWLTSDGPEDGWKSAAARLGGVGEYHAFTLQRGPLALRAEEVFSPGASATVFTVQRTPPFPAGLTLEGAFGAEARRDNAVASAGDRTFATEGRGPIPEAGAPALPEPVAREELRGFLRAGGQLDEGKLVLRAGLLDEEGLVRHAWMIWTAAAALDHRGAPGKGG